jgi:hypothetical protein
LIERSIQPLSENVIRSACGVKKLLERKEKNCQAPGEKTSSHAAIKSNPVDLFWPLLDIDYTQAWNSSARRNAEENRFADPAQDADSAAIVQTQR